MSADGQGEERSAPRPGDRFSWTIPNVLSGVRLIGSILLLPVALAGRPLLFLTVFLVVAGTDWIDGKLAIWLKQQTTFGARLDSVADAAMYAALLLGSLWLKGDVLLGEAGWIAAAVATYATSCLAALIKFRRLPSYHTYSAKFGWFLTVVAAVAVLSGWAVWPLRLVAFCVALGNVETLLITLFSSRWRADIPTLWHALRAERDEEIDPRSRDASETPRSGSNPDRSAGE